MDWRLAAGAGLLIGAAVVGVLWAALGGGSSSTIGHAKLTAPSRLGIYVRVSDAPLSRSGPGKAVARREAAWSARTALSVAAAYGGAAATVENYTDQKFENRVTLIEVRAPTPRPFVLYVDPKALGLARAPSTVTHVGDVDCLVANQPTVAGRPPAADTVTTSECLRSSPHLTVIAEPQGDISRHPDVIVGLVDQAFTASS